MGLVGSCCAVGGQSLGEALENQAAGCCCAKSPITKDFA